MASAGEEEILAKFAPSYFNLSSKENDMSLDSSLDSLSSMDWTNSKISTNFDPKYQSSHNSTKIVSTIPSEINLKNSNKYLWYDDDSGPYFLQDDETIMTAPSSIASSAENAFMYDEVDVYQLHEDELGFNYRGPKVLPINETPVTICTANTVGTLRSRKLFRVLLDSGSTGCWIRRSALPQGIVPKVLNKDKQSNTLAGKLSANEMVVLRDLRLPKV